MILGEQKSGPPGIRDDIFLDEELFKPQNSQNHRVVITTVGIHAQSAKVEGCVLILGMKESTRWAQTPGISGGT